MDYIQKIMNKDMNIRLKISYLIQKIIDLNCSVLLDDEKKLHFIYQLKIEDYHHIQSIDYQKVPQHHLVIHSDRLTQAIQLKDNDEMFLKNMEYFLNHFLKEDERFLFYHLYFLNHSLNDISKESYICLTSLRKQSKQLHKTLNNYLSKNS